MTAAIVHGIEIPRNWIPPPIKPNKAIMTPSERQLPASSQPAETPGCSPSATEFKRPFKTRIPTPTPSSSARTTQPVTAAARTPVSEPPGERGIRTEIP